MFFDPTVKEPGPSAALVDREAFLEFLKRKNLEAVWIIAGDERAMEYIPGSHKLDQIPHRDTFAKHNLLTRGQEVMVEVDHSRRRIITLRPGEMSLHHVRLVHGSPPNPSNNRRIGSALRYIPTDVAQHAGEDSATLVRGADRHHHFMSEPQPSRDLDPDFVALHRAITECGARILYRGTEIASYNEPKALAQRG